MRYTLMLSVVVLAGFALGAAPEAASEEGAQREVLAPRYGVAVDLEAYPQDSPQETIRSVIRATKRNQIEYLLAQLIVPREVDAKFQGNPAALRALATLAAPDKSKQMTQDLQRHLSEGTWTIRRDRAVSRAEGVADLSLEKHGRRWYLSNRIRGPQELSRQ